MIARSSYGHACTRLILVLAAFLVWNALSVSPAAAQGGYPFPLYLYDTYPNPPYEVTSTYANGHITDRNNNVIYVTLDQDGGQIYDLASHVIGFIDTPTAFHPAPILNSTVPASAPMSALVLLLNAGFWRIRW